MKFTDTGIAGAWIVDLPRYGDDRGWFQEWFKASGVRTEIGVEFVPVQANISKSRAGTIRGIHYSLAPGGQGKLVTVMSGVINDYVVDIREGSPTFGEWKCIRLDADTPKAVLIDPHLGHAFQALADDTVVSYLVTAEFDPAVEHGISPLCGDVDIRWQPGLEQLLSPKDIEAPSLSDRRSHLMLPNFNKQEGRT